MSDNLTDTGAINLVCATFYDPTKSLIVEQLVKLPTGLQAGTMATRNACQDHAREKGYPLFSFESAPWQGTTTWLVFKMAGRQAVFLKSWPNQASAEMWMQHNGS